MGSHKARPSVGRKGSAILVSRGKHLLDISHLNSPAFYSSKLYESNKVFSFSRKCYPTYLALTAIHLFLGVNAATIGTFPEYNGNNLSSTKNIIKREPNPEPGRDSEFDFDFDFDDDGDIDDYGLKQLSPEELEKAFRLMSEIPDKVLE
ncbi:predicted protein [Histoplasma capsulatum var. duboisii H88]|uniref:Predicted protein n=1 Tax=Ajellomyces capsulatus (strain H88) TaxID=544711 RepID=F0U673_AJEC8|nr:predicted protein [Histoplasma capsulatum var. duboisii H88]